MSRATVKRSLVVMTALLMGGGLLSACGGGGAELSLIRAFFQASRFGDRTTLGNMTMVFFEPEENGIASSPSIDSVTEEQRRSLRLSELNESLQEIQDAETVFRDEKRVYQDENEEAIARVLEAQRDAEDVDSDDEEVGAAWNTWVSDEREFARKVSDAQNALNTAVRIAEASVYDPANPVNVADYTGELVTKDVTVTATISKDGNSEERTMVFTIQKVELQGEAEDDIIDGRWIITALEE
jgi:hypothetical protein